MDALRESRWWDKALEANLPDCRVRSEDRVTFWRGRTQWEKVYCANCGIESGAVSANWTPHVFFVCDACFSKIGKPPGLIEVDPRADSPPPQ